MNAFGTEPTHNTAETSVVEAEGTEFAYRRFGRPAELPLIMLQHFRGNLDDWDPALTDALAAEREVILVDYAGVGSSTGEPSRTIASMARQMIASSAHSGSSRSTCSASRSAGPSPRRWRSCDRRSSGGSSWRPPVPRERRGCTAGARTSPPPPVARASPENLLYIMFAHTDTSQAKGMEFLGRFMQRQEGRDAPTSYAARDAQYDAIVEWGIPDHAALQRLTGIESPTLVIQGDGDLMAPTKLSHLMAGLIPDARIRIHPDAARGFLFQYPIEVAAQIGRFLG
jgi:pimeloyl-ACP methyl ester carboxylesterase